MNREYVNWEIESSFTSEQIRQQPNGLGKAGWELVSVDDGVAYFKRPLQPSNVG